MPAGFRKTWAIRTPTVAAMLLAPVVSLAAPAPPALPKVVRTQVRYVHTERIFLDAGREDGVLPGAQADVMYKGASVARLKVDSSSAHHSAAIFIKRTRVPRPGDVVVIRGATVAPKVVPVATTAVPEPVDPNAWRAAVVQQYPQVAFRARPYVPPPPRVSAFLTTQVWNYTGLYPMALTARQRFNFHIDAPLDARDHWHVSGTASVTGQALHPGDAMFEKNGVAFAEVREALLAYRGIQGLEVGLGRRAAPGLRYALLDGAHASWHFNRGPTVRLMLGERPDTLNLRPDYRRPAAVGELDGAVSLGRFASFGYGGSVSWLGRNVVDTEATEASARFSAEALRILYLDADAAAVAYLARKNGAPAVAMDRAGVSVGARLGQSTVVRVTARRLGGAVLPSESAVLPPGYLGGVPIYDVNAMVDGTLQMPWGTSLGAGLASGALWDSVHSTDRFYVAPEVRARLSRLWGLHVRAAYHGELGPTRAQLVDLGVGAEPLTGLRLNAWGQSGVWFLQDTGQVLPTAQFAFGMEYRFLRILTVGARARSIYGMAGQGVEMRGYVGAVDWL